MWFKWIDSSSWTEQCSNLKKIDTRLNQLEAWLKVGELEIISATPTKLSSENGRERRKSQDSSYLRQGNGRNKVKCQ